MKRGLAVVLFLMPLVLIACSNQTALSFTNHTECGTATITITDPTSGSNKDYTLEEGKEVTIEIDHGVTYRYNIVYAGRPDSDLTCEDKSGSVMVPSRGQSSNFELISATPTPTAQ
jgi:hypothetical protein